MDIALVVVVPRVAVRIEPVAGVEVAAGQYFLAPVESYSAGLVTAKVVAGADIVAAFLALEVGSVLAVAQVVAIDFVALDLAGDGMVAVAAVAHLLQCSLLVIGTWAFALAESD